MPELPEVETIVRGLRKKIIGRTIKSVWIGAPALIKKMTARKFGAAMKNRRLLSIERRAKNILLGLSGGKTLLIHQKMTGHLLYGRWKISKNGIKVLSKGSLAEKDNQYIRLIFNLDNGWQLALSDLRKFAKVVLNSNEEIFKLPDLADLGPEPLERNFNLKKLKDVLSGRKGKIKTVLMNPKIVSGIGNIYSDEILWSAKVNPFRSAGDLKESELKKILAAIKKILSAAVAAGGSSVGDYRDSSGAKGNYQNSHRVYGREKEPCFRCGHKISRRKIGGRSAHFCPQCQKD